MSGTKNHLNIITGLISKLISVELKNSLGNIKDLKLFLGSTLLYNVLRGGKECKPFSLGSNFTGLIFTGELSRLDLARPLRQVVLFERMLLDCFLYILKSLKSFLSSKHLHAF